MAGLPQHTCTLSVSVQNRYAHSVQRQGHPYVLLVLKGIRRRSERGQTENEQYLLFMHDSFVLNVTAD